MFLILKKSIVKRIGILLVIIVVMIGSSGLIFQKKPVETSAEGNWGLSFQQAGQPPVANATKEELKEYNAFYCEDTKEKVLYLTFDAGYENGYTEKILDILKKHKINAAFFLVGNYIQTNPDLVRRMVREGHIVGNHTFHHPDMSEIASEEAFKEELASLELLYKETTGKPMKKYYRPPQGKYSQENLEMAKQLGYTTVFWSLAYVDWYENQQPSRVEALKKLIPRIHPGAVVLLHSTSETNAQVLDEVINKWKEQGYGFKTIDQLGK